MASKYGINDIVEMKKQHACGTNRFKLLEWVLTLELSVKIVNEAL
ncbi:Putative cytosolic protein [Staphylococcus aureus]|nr:Putative cytosolic protein [Staphylococcus aureus]